MTAALPDLAIRAAAAADAPALSMLLGELGYPTDADALPLRLQRLAANRGAALVAVQGQDVVGFATVHVLSVLNRPRDVAWLTALVVASSGRRVGIGRALVRAVEAHALAQGCERLSVTTHEDRNGARAFYPALGLAPTGRRFGKALGSGDDPRAGGDTAR